MLLTLFRVFIFCRLPISLFALGGLKLFLGDASTEELSMLVFLGLLVYLGVVLVKLFRLRADAHRYAWFLLALEAIGAFLFVARRDFAAGIHIADTATWGFAVLLLWVAPNVKILLWARKLFTEPAREKPGV